MTAPISDSTPLASSSPIGTPTCGQLALSPRLVGVARIQGHQHRAAPLAAEPEALQEPQRDQQDRRPDADASS